MVPPPMFMNGPRPGEHRPASSGLGRRRLLMATAAAATQPLALSACALDAFSRLDRNLQALDQLAALFGEAIDARGSGSGAVTVVALERQGQGWRVESSATSIDGRFVLRVQAHRRYRLVAFSDPEQERRGNPSRPLGIVDDWLATPAEGVAPRRVLLLADGWHMLDGPTRAVLHSLDEAPARALPVSIGQTAGLANAMFDPATGSLGLWAPFDFLASVGGGVYQLQPYDPVRPPVVLVHGAAGSPRDFAAIAGRLNDSPVQPWVFHYPSGLRLEAAARMLAGIVAELARRHAVRRLAVVAHSMGGLVSLAAIQQLGATAPTLQVPLLATISTPWAGHPAAAWGVRFAPTVVPSWVDMQVDSPFQRRQRELGLPRRTRHHLYFSYRGNGDDGTVSLASQLQRAMQASAARIQGFDEDHSSVLGSADLVAELERSLREHF